MTTTVIIAAGVAWSAVLFAAGFALCARAARPPVPGQRSTDAAAPAPARPSPAPGHHARLICVTRDYDCGCRHYHDPAGRLITAMPCQPEAERPDALDLEIRALYTQEDG